MLTFDGTFIFAAISFLIFLFVLKAILYHPITKVIEERNNFYAKNSKMESETKEKSQALIDEKDKAIKEARTQAGEVMRNALNEAKEQNELEIKEAKKAALEKIEQNQNVLFDEQNQAKNEIKAEISNIVQSIVSKVLKEEITIELDENKISQHLKV